MADNEAPDTGIHTIEDALLYVVRHIPANHRILADLEQKITQHFGQDTDTAEQDQAEPVTVADQKAAGVPPEQTVTVADQRAGAEPPAQVQPQYPAG